MKRIKKYFLFMSFVGLFILLMNVNAYSLIKNNGSGKGYDETTSMVVQYSDNSIEALIIQGAGHYFLTRVNVDSMHRMIELKDIDGFDATDFMEEVDAAISNMKKAIQVYEILINKAESTPYNKIIQAQLKDFNYDFYMLNDEINKDIFEEVKNFLSGGDITGALKKTCADISQILNLLQTVKSESALNKIADVSIFWKINETFARSDLFGSYVARIFSAIR